MATHEPLFKYPDVIHHPRYCRNGEPVLASPMRKVGDAINHIAAYRQKCILMRSKDMPAMGSGAAGTNVLWRGYGYSGYGVTRLRCIVLCKKADNSATVDPLALLVVVGGTSGTQSASFRLAGYTSSSTPAPNVISQGTIDIDIVENETISFSLSEVDYLSIVSACVYFVGATPVDDTGTGGVNPLISVGSNILDSQNLDMATAVTGLWQKNAAHIFSWAADGTANSPTRSNSATYRNILDSSSTSVTAATPGIRVQHQYHNRITPSSTVPTRLAVYAQRTSGAGDTAKNAVRMSDGTNTVTVTGIGNTAQWYTADASIPASADAKYDIMARTSTVADGGAADAIRIDAVSWLEYQ